jgi:L-fucose isomerase
MKAGSLSGEFPATGTTQQRNIKTGRLQGDNPKIGIRPTIDGRQGGVRESLEEQTMTMANSLADFLSSSLKYSDGTPVECVIADTTIGRVDEAAACAEKFKKEGVAITITVTPCWCYGSETIDMDPHTVKAVWGFNGTERPGAVYLAAALAGHNQKGLPAFGIYGHDVLDGGDTSIPADVQEKLLRFAKAAIAVASMKGKSYLSIGSVSMGIAGSIVNADFFQEYLGMRNEYVDMSEINRRVQLDIFDPEEFKKAMEWTEKNCKSNEGEDTNEAEKKKSREQLDKEWEFVVKMTIIMRDLMIGNPKLRDLGFLEEALGHNAIAGGFQGQRQWTDFMPNGDFAEAILNTSFDWNGIREAFVMATENDSLNGVAMLFGKLVTNTAQVFADVRTYWSPEAVERVTGHKMEGLAANGLIHLINSGSAALDGSGQQTIDGKPAMKPFWEITEEEVQKTLDATTWYPADCGYFRGGGFSSKFISKGGMPVTMSRINLVKGLGPVLQIAEGWTAELPAEVHQTLDDRTNKTWPTTWFAPRLTGEGNFRDVYSVMNNWGANHGAFSYGHIGADLITLASMLRIPVCMHNVDEAKIFRPSAWAAYGMNVEGADYRACQTYGALYK